VGLFGSLFGGSREERESKRIRDLSKRAQEKYGDPAARTRALEQLRDIGSEEAIAALLQRFTVKTEPGITDAEEREFTLSIITSFGEKAVGPIEAFIRSNDSIAWALRCLEEIVPEERVIGTLTAELEKLAGEYTREPDKKVLIINRLAATKDPRIPPAVRPFLDDAADDVRIAAMKTLLAQGDAASADAIAACLIDAEAPRVRTAAAATLAELAAPIGARRDEVAAKLPAGYALDDGGVVRKA